MPIIHQTESAVSILTPQEFVDEAELQVALAAHPELLLTDHEPAAALVRREIVLPGAGRADLLLVDTDGLPIVVECKLARNPESRRDVFAQVFDYVSSLSLLTADELDQTVDGALEDAISSFSGDGSADGYKHRWLTCATNLRAGRVRVVVAIDEASEDLIRLFRFMNDHSDLDVRLVAIGKYGDKIVGTVLVPNLLVAGSSGRLVTEGHRERASIRSDMRDVLESYDRAAAPGFELGKGAKAYNYRQIQPEGWPVGLHYEIFDDTRAISVELHLETDVVRPLAGTLIELSKALEGALPLATIEWDPKWYKGRGRLRAIAIQGASSEDIANTVKEFIEKTYQRVAAAVV